jgi:hypothetical protein
MKELHLQNWLEGSILMEAFVWLSARLARMPIRVCQDHEFEMETPAGGTTTCSGISCSRGIMIMGFSASRYIVWLAITNLRRAALGNIECYPTIITNDISTTLVKWQRCEGSPSKRVGLLKYHTPSILGGAQINP